MDIKKVAGIVAAFLVLLWILGRFVSSPAHSTAISVAASQANQPAPQDKWRVKEDRSPMDDSKTVLLTLDSDDVIQGPIGAQRPSLIVRCKERKTTVYVVTGMAASVEEDSEGGPSDGHTVKIRLDQDTARTDSWSESTDNKALFADDLIYDQSGNIAAFSGGAAAFAKQLAGAQTLTFQFMPFDASPAVARFDLRGLSTHLSKVADACGWSVN